MTVSLAEVSVSEIRMDWMKIKYCWMEPSVYGAYGALRATVALHRSSAPLPAVVSRDLPVYSRSVNALFALISLLHSLRAELPPPTIDV